MNWYKKSQNVKEELYIQPPDSIHNNYGMVLISQDQNKLHKFITYCRGLPKELHVFWQSGSHKSGDLYPTYQYFEFWADNQQDLIMEIAEKISEVLNIKLEIK